MPFYYLIDIYLQIQIFIIIHLVNDRRGEEDSIILSLLVMKMIRVLFYARHF
jgi:hypothetical protein